MAMQTQTTVTQDAMSDWWRALAVTGHDVRPGDAVFFHTGWGGLWGTGNEQYASGEPGPGLALGEWLAGHRVALTGCDTWSFGPYPPESRCEPFAAPQMLNVRHGAVVVENLRLEKAAREQRAFEIEEYTDSDHQATVPHTLVVAPGLVVDKVYVGYWFWGRPSPFQLWEDLQNLLRRAANMTQMARG